MELIQMVTKLLDGPLFSVSNMVPQPLNIRDNVARQHE